MGRGFLFGVVLACVGLTLAMMQIAAAATDVGLYSRFGISPDGTRIAYPVPAFDESGEMVSNIYVARLDGSQQKQIAVCPGTPSISWAGNAHLVGTEDLSDKIQFISLNGERRSIALAENTRSLYPVVSPDGKWVAFSAYNAKQKQIDLSLLDLKSGAIRLLASDLVKSQLAWSPDSTMLAYGEGAYQQKYKLKILDVQTGQITDTGKLGVGVAWSPDGQWLAYTGDIIWGGTWNHGVPSDGSIVTMNVATKETRMLTPPAVNSYDKPTKHEEVSGALDPVWSPDGKQIAYRRIHTIADNDVNSLNEDAIWVMHADGTGAKKLKDAWSRFVWDPDGTAIFVKTATGIERIVVDSGKSSKVVKWDIPVAKPMAEQTMTGDGADAKFTGVRPEYAKALLAIIASARKVYSETFGFDMPQRITLNISRNDQGRVALWTDGESQMFLTVRSSDDLAPPMKSGTFNIYGMCHELGHMAMYRRVQPLGLPDGVAEGWAYYVGSVVVDHVYHDLGENVYPQPYNYAEVEGTARLAGQEKDGTANADSTTRAALMFYRAQQQYGEATVIAAMKTALDGRPMGKDLMPRFADALVKLTKNESARAAVPAEFLIPKVTWKVAHREIDAQTTAGEAQVSDAGGMLLKYDDGTGEGKRSTGGAGHAVIFYAPEGSWAVDSVQLYAERYGEPEPPKENFFIFICDQDFNVIKTIEKPYSTFPTYDAKWYTVSFDPVNVPRGFYVCVYFNATAEKGVYLYYDTDIKMVHSRSALPWTFVSDLDEANKYDWMIRAHLVKAVK